MQRHGFRRNRPERPEFEFRAIAQDHDALRIDQEIGAVELPKIGFEFLQRAFDDRNSDHDPILIPDRRSDIEIKLPGRRIVGQKKAALPDDGLRKGRRSGKLRGLGAALRCRAGNGNLAGRVEGESEARSRVRRESPPWLVRMPRQAKAAQAIIGPNSLTTAYRRRVQVGCWA